MIKISSSIQKSILLAGIVMASHGCKIDIAPTDRYTEEAIWKNPANMELYVNGLYAEFQTFKFGQFPIGYSNATDALTDIMKYTASTAGNGTVNILATDATRVNAAGPQLNYWQAAYTRIRRINEFIDGLRKYAVVSDAEKDLYEAEARFVRGYVYFWLVKLHGSVIIMDDLAKHTVKDNPRSSEDDCWKFIASDFTYAAEKLPPVQTGIKAGRATKGAAYGMLARTWLYAASIAKYDRKQFNEDPLTGVPEANALAYYKNAADAAGEVIKLANEGYYELESDFAALFTNKNTKEAVFKLDFVAPQFTHQYDLGFTPPGDVPGQCLVYGVPTAELVDEFEMNDGTRFSWSNPAQAADPYANREQRFYGTILYNGASWKGRTINTTPSSATEGIMEYGVSTEPRKTVTGYYVRKMLDQSNTNFIQNKSTQPWIEMRYAEILLIDAEAKAGMNDVSGSQNSLNALREKRGLPNTPASTPAQLMTAIEHERKVELAFEGHRYWDLRRWRKAHTVLNKVRFSGHRVSAEGTGFKYEKISADNADRQFTPDLYYMPIIINELQNNDALDQIKGW